MPVMQQQTHVVLNLTLFSPWLSDYFHYCFPHDLAIISITVFPMI